MKALGGILVALAFFYALYAGGMMVWSYIQIAGAVDKAWEEQGRNGAGPVRTAIIKGAAAAGVPLDVRLVTVAEDERVLSVAVRWLFPAISYKDDVFLEVPLSLHRTFDKPPG